MAEASASPSPRRRVLVVVVALAAIAGGYAMYARHQANRPLEWFGTIEARAVSVGSRTGGRVHEVLVREGDMVEPGQALVVLEAGELPARRTQAEGQLAETRAALARLQAGARPEEIAEAKARAAEAYAYVREAKAGPRSEEIAAARARLDAAQAKAEKATVDAKRTRALAERGAVPDAEVEAADTAMRASNAERDAMSEALRALERGTRPEEVQQAQARASAAKAAAELVEAGTRIEDLSAAEARVTAARGRLEQIDVEIAELTIRAPRVARVEALDLRPGDILGPNSTAAKLLEPGQLFVRVYVPETQLGHVHAGLEVPIAVDTFPDRSFRGVVEFVSDEGEFTPRNLQTADERANQVFAARIRLEEGADVLRAGMAATVRVTR